MTFSINRLVPGQKIVTNVDRSFPKPKVTSLNILFCPQPRDIQFIVTENQKTENTHLEAEIRDYGHFFLKKNKLKIINDQNSC